MTNNPFCDCGVDSMYEQNARTAVIEESNQRGTNSTAYVSQNYAANSNDYDERRRAMFDSSRSKHNHRVAVSKKLQAQRAQRQVLES